MADPVVSLELGDFVDRLTAEVEVELRKEVKRRLMENAEAVVEAAAQEILGQLDTVLTSEYDVARRQPRVQLFINHKLVKSNETNKENT